MQLTHAGHTLPIRLDKGILQMPHPGGCTFPKGAYSGAYLVIACPVQMHSGFWWWELILIPSANSKIYP